ncbi:MAG: T9SS type A sorting domain-containing protein, partial [Bacteroidales bacterium]|nr:T9SS type A sorting domain-containing protein [Bacteroidales bacterium]
LARGQSDTITIGSINYTAGLQTVKIWINNLNNGALMDEYSEDDTLSTSVMICSALYNGTLTIGNGGDFPNIEVAYRALSICGINGDITLAFLPGNYHGSLDLSNSSTVFGNYKLTITSSTGNASEVHFVSPSVAVSCENTHNLTIKNLTIDVTQGSNGIQFSGYNSNITIDGCTILANPTVATTGYTGIYKTGGSLDGLHIIHCIIDGGYQGISLVGTSVSFCQNIWIDNNIMTNQYCYGVYLSYVNAQSISYNRISPRSENAGTTWTALAGLYVRNGGRIVSNHISANNSAISANLRGVYFMMIDTALIANNEIYLNSNATTTDGIYINGPRVLSVINNSVYTIKSGTTGTNRAHYNSLVSGFSAVIKNNLFVAQGGGATTTYAFYFNGTAANYTTDGANYEVDYNNYYSSGDYIGYVAGGNCADLTAWRTNAPLYDTNSANILPVFIDSSLSLELATYPDSLSCPIHPDVTKDINDIPRWEITKMGAYIGLTNGQDLMLIEVAQWNTEVLDKQTVDVNVTLYNNGTVPITETALKWSLNGAPPVSVPYSSLVLNSTEQEIVSVGSFTVNSSISNYDVVVWVETVNGQADTLNWNDTIKVSAVIKPLAEFVSPLVPDTTFSVLFPVNVFIRSWTGATITNPKMIFISTGQDISYDTVNMTIVGNNWQAMIPQQHYNSKVVYSLILSDTIGNSLTLRDTTYIPSLFSILNNPALADLSLAEPLTITNVSCSGDSSAMQVALENKTTADYRFSKDTLVINYEIINPMQTVYKGSIPYTGSIAAGATGIIELIPSFAIFYAGSYDIKVWLSSPSDNTPYYDTLRYTYVSNRVALPVDEDFSSGIPTLFNVQGDNSPAMWRQIPQGMGVDTAVVPVFGTGILAFTGDKGAMTTLATRQMDLSQTTQPSLSFWYFHDTIPCEDYTDVRITIDGGATYNTLYSLTKYNPVYGWKQYSADLPAYAINQCVALVFEAMEKSNGDVTQYIDRILITARQDIAVSEILTSELSVCDLQNKEIKVVMSNLSIPVLDYTTNPTTLTLEVKETGQMHIYDTLLSSRTLGSFISDTITLATGFNFATGNYTLKAYFSSILDVDRNNDTLVVAVVINPALSVQVQSESTPNCLAGELTVHPSITINNTGNMDLSDIDLTIQIDTGDNNPAVYALFREIYADTILAGNNATYTFSNSYTVPWNARYDVRATVYLSCDSAMANATNMIPECVDVKDLRIVSIDNPTTGTIDNIGSSIQVRAMLNNRSDGDIFNSLPVTYSVTNSQGIQTESSTENITVGLSETISHTFTIPYTVPNDTVYYITVYIESRDNYRNNDTMTIRRETNNVSVETLEGNVFTLGQNIPNPAKSTTRIDYSIPEAGEIVFHVQSVSGQLLYSKTIEAASGINSLELNTNTLAAGIYIYSIEYKGQRLVKRMSVQK